MIETGLLTWLKANVPSVSNRVYAVQAPQTVTAPYLVFQKISAPRGYHFTGADEHVRSRFQLTAVDATYAGAKAVSEELRAALSGYRGLMGATSVSSAYLDNEFDDHDPDAALYWVVSDYLITYAE